MCYYNHEVIHLEALELVAAYVDGMTVADVAKLAKISTGRAYSLMKGAGCSFRPSGTPRGYKHTRDFCEKISKANKGKIISQEQRIKQSEAMKQHYNGLNGYGHLKKHCRGYVLCYAPDHPHAHKDGYIMLHTVIMEIHLGRYITEREVVHHANGIRNDNALDNLVLMTKHDHMSMHTRIRRKSGGRYLE